MAEYVDSYYARSLLEPGAYPALEGEIETETVVVGGGLAGGATARDLAERGRKVVLVEAHEIGWGACGRNGGFVSTGVPTGIPALVRRVGLAAAQAIYRECRMGHALLRERIAKYAIQCGPIQDGALRCNMARPSERLEELCAMMARDFDTQYEYWPRTRVSEALATAQYSDGFFNPYTYCVHPLNLTRGLARAAAPHGALILAKSPVTALVRSHDPSAVRTRSGGLRADRVVLTCGGDVCW